MANPPKSLLDEGLSKLSLQSIQKYLRCVHGTQVMVYHLLSNAKKGAFTLACPRHNRPSTKLAAFRPPESDINAVGATPKRPVQLAFFVKEGHISAPQAVNILS